MTHDQLLTHANHVRDVVLDAEGKVLSGRTRRAPPYSAYRNSPKGRKAWLAKAEVGLAREPLPFGGED
jgi:hypothetical protein